MCKSSRLKVVCKKTFYEPNGVPRNLLKIRKSKYVLTLWWWGPLSYRNQSIDLLCKSMDWFLDDNGPRHERVKLVFDYIMFSLASWYLHRSGVFTLNFEQMIWCFFFVLIFSFLSLGKYCQLGFMASYGISWYPKFGISASNTTFFY